MPARLFLWMKAHLRLLRPRSWPLMTSLKARAVNKVKLSMTVMIINFLTFPFLWNISTTYLVLRTYVFFIQFYFFSFKKCVALSCDYSTHIEMVLLLDRSTGNLFLKTSFKETNRYCKVTTIRSKKNDICYETHLQNY